MPISTLNIPRGVAIYGTAAADTIVAPAGENWIGGGGGADSLTGGPDLDYMFGEDGADTLVGGAGDDFMYGGAGDDLLQGGVGFDYLVGGPGNDTLQAGADVDLISYERATGGVTVSLAIAGPQTVGGGEGVDIITDAEGLIGGAFGDGLTGDAGGNFLEGRGGDDTIDGGGGFDTVYFRFAAEGVKADLSRTGPQFISASEGTDTFVNIEGLTGSHFGDELRGDGNNNRLIGRMGDDTFAGGGGNDTVDGGQGTDTLILTGRLADYAESFNPQGQRMLTDLRPGSPDGVTTLIDIEQIFYDDAFVAGQGGAYSLALANPPSNVTEADEGLSVWTVDLVRSGQLDKPVNYNWLLRGAGANPATGADFMGQAFLQGTFGFQPGTTHLTLAIPILGNLLQDGDRMFELVITTPEGVMILRSAIIDDESGGGPPPTTGTLVERFTFGDVIEGSSAADTILGGAGADTLAGGDGNDSLIGGDGADVLFGEAGADTLAGGGGNDILRGGAGDDSLSGGDGTDSLRGDQGNDLIDGGAGTDYARYDRATGAVTVDLRLTGSQAIGADQGADTLIGIEGVIGSDFADRLTGDGGGNVLGGRGGDDTLDGGGGVDYVAYSVARGGVTVDLALAGAQSIGGGEGSDTLISIEGIFGSAFADRLSGNASGNTLRGGDGADTLSGGGGYDFLYGDDGDDTAWFTGPLAAYARTLRGDGSWLVTDNRAGSPDGTVELFGVERHRFTDQTLRVAPAPGLSVSLSPSAPVVLEGDGALSLWTAEVTRGGDLSAAVSYNWFVEGSGAAPASAADFLGGLLGGSLSFAAGQSVATIIVPIRGNTAIDGDRTFTVTLETPLPISAVVTIADDDNRLPQLRIGTAQADTLYGQAGDDAIEGAGGDDVLDGLGGTDKATYTGTSGDYAWWRAEDGDWRVQDLRAGAPDGLDVLKSIEQLGFSDRTLKIDGLTTQETLSQAFEYVLRGGPASAADTAFLNSLTTAVTIGAKTLPQAYADLAQRADGTTAVAAMTYQFFLGFAPSKGGFDFLVSPTGPNPNNINSAYYQSFDIINRFINFAVNVGAGGEGRPAFQADFGGLTLFQATKLAYADIFGGIPSDAKVDALLTSPVIVGGEQITRADYLAIYGGDGPVFATVKIDPEALPFVLPPSDGVILTSRFRQSVLGDEALYN